ncbi:anamorsin homolog [Rutidosis leptorrhynchoides]|uniref:anamorsin homolog n=1 Tax=Rutidosis leptorrhynchoides TaxID=125765 RepID=UPI003A99A985
MTDQFFSISVLLSLTEAISISIGTQGLEDIILALIENVVIPLHEVLKTVRLVKKDAVEKINPLIITQASSLSSLPMDPSQVDFIITMGKSEGFPSDKLFLEILRVLKPGGEIFVHQTLDSSKENTTSSLERKLLVAGFSDIEVVRMAEVLSEGVQSFGVKGKKPSWKIDLPPEYNELFRADSFERPLGQDQAKKVARTSQYFDAATSSRGTSSSKVDELMDDMIESIWRI